MQGSVREETVGKREEVLARLREKAERVQNIRDKEEEMEAMMKFDVVKIARVEGLGKLKAFADLLIGDSVVIKGLRVVEGNNGEFVSFPRKVGKDGKWYETVSPMTPEIRSAISKIVLQRYIAVS